MTPGPRNALTDVSGIRVGHAQDMALLSGTTVVLPDEPAVVAVDCRGGGPGTRETDALQPSTLVEVAHAIVFSGGDDPVMEPWGTPTHPAATPVDGDRQAFETTLNHLHFQY